MSPPKLGVIRKIALGLPQAREVEDRLGLWFNVGKKSFALYSGRRWIFKLPMAQQMMLFEARPETFAPMRAGKLLWSFVAVENLDAAELRDLLYAAWTVVAPKKLIIQQGATREPAKRNPPPQQTLIRRIALSLPGASETFYKGPRFGVGKKAFVHGWIGEELWLFKLPHHQEMMLFDTRPTTFTPMRSGPMLWCYANVRHLEAAELRDLIVAAWRTVAPRKLQAQYGQPSTSPKQIK
jgi:hypothetical protein